MNQSKALKQLVALKKLGHTERLAAEEWDEEWKIIIATLLSAQTRDTTTIPIAEKLFKAFPTTKKLGKANIEEIELILKPLNYYKTKSRNTIRCAAMLEERWQAKPPHNTEELIELPGVGRKTANVFLSEIGQAAIGVDTHVAQVAYYLGWTKEKNPDKVEEDLKKLFPKKKWKEINLALVRFGQKYRKRHEWEDHLEKIKLI